MGTTNAAISKTARRNLAHFLMRRQLKDRMVSILEKTKNENELKRGQVTTAKNASYETIVESLSNAISSNWISVSEVISELENAEIAGRQHICLFKVDEKDITEIEKLLKNPKTLNSDEVEIDEFWSIPLEPYTRFLSLSNQLLTLKIVTSRKYWVDVERITKEEYYKVEKRAERERSAIIIKLDIVNRLLQFRVPIKENSTSSDTSKSVYEFIAEIIDSQYGKEGIAFLNRISPLDVSLVFQKLIQNRQDFVLHSDYPENKKIKSTMSNKGTPMLTIDIRDAEEWVFDRGFARSCIRGMWKTSDNQSVDMRMYYDSIKVNDTMSRSIARLFFPKPYTDQEVEHVIRRILDHF